MDNGWIKLHRKLLDSPLWKDCTGNQKAVLVTLLLLANHEPNKWIFNGIEYQVDAGQFITSLKSIAEESGTTINVVRKSLMKFKKYNFSTYQSTNKNRLITIENWEKYQSKDDYGTSNSTSTEQAENKQRTTNKNDKNDKNVRTNNSVKKTRHKHGEYGRVLLADSEYEKLIKDYGEILVKEYIEKVDEYCQQYNKSYGDYNLTIRKWLKKDGKCGENSSGYDFSYVRQA